MTQSPAETNDIVWMGMVLSLLINKTKQNRGKGHMKKAATTTGLGSKQSTFSIPFIILRLTSQHVWCLLKNALEPESSRHHFLGNQSFYELLEITCKIVYLSLFLRQEHIPFVRLSNGSVTQSKTFLDYLN